jgi:photosystem II stability/assembly factor-like uncharacterized protein
MTSWRNLLAGRAWGLAALFALVMAACGGAAPVSPPSVPGTGKPAGFEPTAVSFVSPGRGWVLGRSGCQDCAGLLLTGDGGGRWTVLPALPAPLGYYNSSANAVMEVAFADAANGFLYGPGLLATHDGGRSWSRQPLPPVQALSVGSRYAYALTLAQPGGSALWRTAIGSGGWARLPLPAGASPPSLSPGYGTLLLYAEGGTLVLLRPGFTGPRVTPGQVGQLWVSLDNGTDWRARPVPCTPPDGGGAAVLSIALRHPDAWLLDCFDSEQSSQEQNTQHHLYGTTDAGLSWVRLPDPTSQNMPDLLADNGSGHAFLATEGIADTLVGSFDGGQHWQTLLTSGGSFYGWADLRFVNAETGFVVGPTHYSPEHLYRTDDGGRTWRPLHL